MLLQKFCTGLITGSIKDLAGLLNRSNLNTLTFQLIRRFYVQLPIELRGPKKGLISIKTNGQKSFLWCHVRHINLVKIHPERITQNNEKLFNDFNYDRIKFLMREKDFSKIETKQNFRINVFSYENRLVFPIYISDQEFENSMDLLLLIDKCKLHYVYIKDFDRFMFHKTKKKKQKNTFSRVVYSALVVKMF